MSRFSYPRREIVDSLPRLGLLDETAREVCGRHGEHHGAAVGVGNSGGCNDSQGDAKQWLLAASFSVPARALTADTNRARPEFSPAATTHAVGRTGGFVRLSHIMFAA